MKKLLLALGIMALICSPAMAGPNANGAMVLHTDDSINYTTGFNFCNQQGLPTTCEALHTRTDKHDPNAAVIFAMAAFLPTASPCVSAVQFGIHHNLPYQQGYIYAWSMCGTLELPDAGWPEDNGSGVGDLVSIPNVTAHVFPFYWWACDENGPGTFFCTRTYPTTNEAKFVDCSQPPIEDLCTNFGCVHWFDDGGVNHCPQPPAGTGACCFADGSCTVVTHDMCTQQGGSYQGDNTVCNPNPCPQPGACCFPDGSCQMLLPAICQAQGGAVHGGSCTPNPCPQPPQACCFADGSCQMLPPDQCTAQGGTPHGAGTVCTPNNPCPQPPTGACCIGQTCTILTQAQCTAQGGTYKGDGTVCDPNPCIPVPTKSATWGQIKANYR